MAERIKNIPSPDILMNSLRSIGYSFKTALADIIDNSISVNAKNIWIDFPSYNSDNLYITILDDAVGMDDAALFNAMKYGSERDEYGDKDLWRFGVGLKSASLSQCRMLTVMSKFDSEVHAYRWDLDEVLRSKEWECLRLDSNEIQACPNYEKLNLLPQGTMVIWQNFDIADQKSNGHAYEYLSEKLDESESHLCLIFHRFMNRSISPVSFFINDRQLKGLDPFLEGSPHHKRNPKTDEGKPVEMAVKYYDKGYEKEAMIKVQTFILPHQDDLSKEDVEALGGMEVLKDEQGFFVYRNDRLIIYGTWFRLSSRSVNAELYKYGRIKVDIPNKLDSLWDIDIKKQNAVIPKQIVNLLRKSVMRVCSTSKEKTGRRVKLNDGENEEQTKAVKFMYKGKEYFKTGTLGTLDEDGFFTLTGRASRYYIISTLNKVYCDKVQSIISLIDVVENACFVGKTDDDMLFTGKAFIVLKPNVPKTEETKNYIMSECEKQFINQKGETVQLEPYEIPTSITFLDELPRKESSDKIDYQILNALAEKEYEFEKLERTRK